MARCDDERFRISRYNGVKNFLNSDLNFFSKLGKVLRILIRVLKGLWPSSEKVSTFEFWLELGAKCKGKTLLVIEIFFTFFNTALSQSSIVAQYPKKNMIEFSQQTVTKQQNHFPAHNLNLEGYKIKSILAYKIFLTLPQTYSLQFNLINLGLFELSKQQKIIFLPTIWI